MAMIWRPNGLGKICLGPGLITNAGVGGLQIKTRVEAKPEEELIVEVGSQNGRFMIPGDVRYCRPSESGCGICTVGLRFAPVTRMERQVLARFLLSLKDRVSD